MHFSLRCGLLSLLMISVTGLSLSVAADETQPAPPVPGDDHPEKAKRGLKLFREQVREILAQRCLECHGGGSIRGDFSLATRKDLLDSGFVGETAAESSLMELIRHEAEPFMPWKKPQLSAQEIAAVGQWIDLGAPYDRPLKAGATSEAGELIVTDADRSFWSFGPLRSVQPPEVSDPDWCLTPIDQFVLARLEQAGIQPNAEASGQQLVRRLSFALLGLPPAAQDVQKFTKDTSSEAWAKLTEEMLRSPHYGERWARHWMDVARFAESHGYEQDYDRPHAYHYRDFLIRAFNQDLPFDQFVSWQLAGDELAPENPLAMMATGFLGAGVFPTQLTETEFESARYDELDDMVMTTGVAFLGLSVGCARCHDHKFDPVPARDYYSLAAVFGTTIRSETQIDLAPEENADKRKVYEQQLTVLQQQLVEFREQALEKRFRSWLQKQTAEQSQRLWRLPSSVTVVSSAGTKFQLQSDASWLASGDAPAGEILTVSGQTGPGGISSLRLEALTHSSLPHGGPGRASNGNFALGNLELRLVGGEAAAAAAPVRLINARATHQQNSDSLSVQASLDSDPVSGWAVDAGGIGTDQAAVFDLETPVAGDHRWELKLTLQHPNGQHTLGRLRVSFAEQGGLEPAAGDVGPPASAIMAMAAIRSGAAPDPSGLRAALDWYEKTDPEFLTLQQQLNDLAAAGPPVQLSTVMVSSEGLPHMKHNADGRGFPHFYPETYVLNRGDVHQKKELARPGFLQVLSDADRKWEHWQVQPPEGSRTGFQRATLARWMTDTESGAGGLVARVIVNRIWLHHFGEGLVSTPNDFGFSGAAPSHPELLEWLAGELVRSGWSIRHLQRLIVSSRVWKQSGESDPVRLQVDRDNRLLWHRPRRRLEAEAIRDAMLSVSGRLDSAQFGPGTLDQNMNRRSIYFFIKRSALIPMMMLFDWPEHLVSIGRRPVTTIAPQALMFMNSAEGRVLAGSFAARLSGLAAEERIEQAWWLAFARSPQPQEALEASEFLRLQQEVYGTDHDAAEALRLALTDLCQTLFAMNEFVYVE